MPSRTERTHPVRMADVTDKPATIREAIAGVEVHAQPETIQAIREGRLAKGDAIAVARLAGIQAAKQAHHLLPLCHPVQVTHVEIEVTFEKDRIVIQAMVRAQDRTGVEMEALTAAAVCALTFYDMAKSVERGMTITDLGLIKKSGGRSGKWGRFHF